MNRKSAYRSQKPEISNGDSTKFEHKFTKEEYQKTRKNVFKEVKAVDERLTPHFNPVKRRIIHIAVENIEQAINYYFNSNTFRASRREAENFMQSLKELANIARFLPPSQKKTEIIDWVDKTLKSVKTQFVAQYSYLTEIEREITSNKKMTQDPQNIW